MVNRKNNEWTVTSTHEGEPSNLSEIAIVTEHDTIMLDELIGHNLDVEITRNPFRFDEAVGGKIIIHTINDIFAMFHEIGEVMVDQKDKVIKKTRGKMMGKTLSGSLKDDFNIDEVVSLIRIRGERLASAYALRMIRKVRDKYGIDLLKDTPWDKLKGEIHFSISKQMGIITSIPEYKQKLTLLQEKLFGQRNK